MRVLARFEHEEMAAFLGPLLGQAGAWVRGWKILLAGGAGWLGYAALQAVLSGTLQPAEVGLRLLAGLAGALLLIPAHELLHGLAYRSVGAPEIRYGGSFRTLTFHCAAPGFEADYPAFRRVALAPVVLLTLALLPWVAAAPGGWHLAVGTTVTAHLAFSAGDIALLDFMHRHRGQGIRTVDVPGRSETLFLVNAQEEGSTGR